MIGTQIGPVRLLLVDDHETARRRLQSRLARQHRVQVVGEAAGGTDALRLTSELRPDAVLIETRRHDQQGIAAVAMFSQLPHQERPAIIACLEIMHRSDWQFAEAAGADDVILTEMPADSLANEVLRIVDEHRRRARSQDAALD